ncbi:hypothetical protein FAUST_6601, partial [Fusarium austroamericanum]
FIKALPEYELTKPYYISGLLPQHHESARTNIQQQLLQQVPLFNLRGQEHNLSIERHGFEIVNLSDSLCSLDIVGSQTVEYMQEMTSIVTRRLEASLVVCYDCCSNPPSLANGRYDTPATTAHIDHTLDSAVRRARRHLTTAEAALYLNGNWRLRIVNVWKPSSIVYDHDLLFCDFATVQHNDLVAVDRVSSKYAGEVYMLKPSMSYDWY